MAESCANQGPRVWAYVRRQASFNEVFATYAQWLILFKLSWVGDSQIKKKQRSNEAASK